MKKALLFLFLVPFLALAENVQPKQSKIEKVTVYLEGASIGRVASINLKPGENVFLFNNLSPDIDESSIQISGLNNASIISIKFNIDYLEKKVLSSAYKTIQAKIEALRHEKTAIQNIIYGYEEERQLLTKNQRINSDATDLSLEKFKEMSAYYRSRVTEIKDAIYSADLNIAKINDQLRDNANELAKLADSKEEKRGEIDLKLDSKKATNLVLQIKYNIKNAGWFPLYDIRATNTSSPIDLSYKANIYQQSGTDWNDVNIVLSTGDPTTDNTKPQILPKYLNFVYANYRRTTAKQSTSYKYNPTIRAVSGTILDDTGLPLPGVNIIENGTRNGTQTDFDGNYTLQVNGGRELSYSYLGFHNKKVPIYSNTMNLNMDADQSQLSEVVVTGYGTKRNRKQEYDIATLLQGKTPGVNITGSNGYAGAASHVVIRGASSLKTSNPLYVIDGVIASKKNISNLNSDNIAEVNVLKGASARAIYGNRASDGVVIVTTKGKQLSNGNSKETGLTAVRFEIAKKYTIKSNAEITVIEIDTFALPATYQHYAAPELNENVFLTATVKDWEKYDLLQGDANIYFEGSYAGKTYLNPLATTDSLNFSLGIDPSIVIKREKIDNFKSKSFLGGSRIIDKGYKIEVKSSKKTAINLVLEDRVPISQNKEIKVDDIEEGDADFNTETGVLKWNIKLASNANIKKEFTYVVKYPKSKRINL